MILRTILIFLFSFSIFSAGLEDWKEAKSFINDKVWKHKNEKHTIIVSNKKKYLKKLIPTEFLSLTIKHKEKALSYLGVTQWKVHHKFIENKEILILGSYIDSEKRRVAFAEKHSFQGNHLKTTLLTKTNTGKIFTRKDVSSLLREVENELP